MITKQSLLNKQHTIHNKICKYDHVSVIEYYTPLNMDGNKQVGQL